VRRDSVPKETVAGVTRCRRRRRIRRWRNGCKRRLHHHVVIAQPDLHHPVGLGVGSLQHVQAHWGAVKL